MSVDHHTPAPRSAPAARAQASGAGPAFHLRRLGVPRLLNWLGLLQQAGLAPDPFDEPFGDVAHFDPRFIASLRHGQIMEEDAWKDRSGSPATDREHSAEQFFGVGA